MSILVYMGTPDQVFNLYKLQFLINDNNYIYNAFTMNLEVIYNLCKEENCHLTAFALYL